MQKKKKATSNQLTPAQQTELEALAALPDEQIDTQDTPEVSDWSGAKQGLFFRPIKQQITLRLDADLIAWFKGRRPHGEGYQTDINHQNLCKDTPAFRHGEELLPVRKGDVGKTSGGLVSQLVLCDSTLLLSFLL